MNEARMNGCMERSPPPPSHKDRDRREYSLLQGLVGWRGYMKSIADSRASLPHVVPKIN